MSGAISRVDGIINRQEELLPVIRKTIELRLSLRKFKGKLSREFVGFSSDIYFYTQAEKDIEKFLTGKGVFPSSYQTERVQLNRLKEVNRNIRELLELLLQNRSGSLRLFDIEDSEIFKYFFENANITLTDFHSFESLEDELSDLDDPKDIEEHHATYLKVIAYTDLLIKIAEKIEANVDSWIYNLFYPYSGDEDEAIKELLNKNSTRSLKMFHSKRKACEYALYKAHKIDTVIKRTLFNLSETASMVAHYVSPKEHDIAKVIFSDIIEACHQSTEQRRVNILLELVGEDIDYIERNLGEKMIGTPYSLSRLADLINLEASELGNIFVRGNTLNVKKILRMYDGVIDTLVHMLEAELEKSEQEDIIKGREHKLFTESYEDRSIQATQSINSIDNEMVSVTSSYSFYKQGEGKEVSSVITVTYDNMDDRVYIQEEDRVSGKSYRFFMRDAYANFYFLGNKEGVLSLEYNLVRAEVLIEARRGNL